MSFTSDIEWPWQLKRVFESLKQKPTNTAQESRYYSGYNKLLQHCFRDSLDYTIAPQAPPPTAPREAADFMVWLLVFDEDLKPVLLVEVKDDSWLSRPATRERADAQMRERYEDVLVDCPRTKLYGISFIGTKMRVYAGDVVTEEIIPPHTPRPDANRTLPKDHLEGEWALDIFSPEGFAKMQEIVGFIRREGDEMTGNPLHSD